MNKATIRLFKSVLVNKQSKSGKFDTSILKKTFPLGYVITPDITSEVKDINILISQISQINDILGISSEQLNSSFHKSWTKIKNASDEQLLLEQVIHYFTTYGFEELGIYDKNSIYIPSEELNVPSLDEGVNVIVIKGITLNELKEKVLKLLNTGIALNQKSIEDILLISKTLKLTSDEIESVKNKEVKCALYNEFNLFPDNPTEFLRYILYKLTGKTLLIKSPAVIKEVAEAKYDSSIDKVFEKYIEKNGEEKLAQIFYRFKPIFLAVRKTKKLKKIINKARKNAYKYHKPMPEDYLNSITGKIKNKEKIDISVLKSELDKVNVFRKIRLAYALKYRTKEDVDSILYKIRNGKGYATEFSFSEQATAKKILTEVVDSISKDVSKNVKGKKIYIPDNLNYSLPATEKLFTGYFPSGTYVDISSDMIVGINWKNAKSTRIDLDLSMVNADAKIGWDGSYRSGNNEILFSGDMTDASGKNGSTELFYIKKQHKKSYLLYVNYFNRRESVEVPFKIIVAKERPVDFKQNYMVNPNNLIASAETTLNVKEKILGLVIVTSTGNRFYFSENEMGKSITAGCSPYSEHARQYLSDFYENTIELKDILIKAGAKLVSKKATADIDLSPEKLEKDTIISLIC